MILGLKDSASYECQVKSGLVECPYCGSLEISKALMAPNIACRSNLASSETTSQSFSENQVTLTPNPEIALRKTFRKLRQIVEKHCDYVGQEFANEARKISKGQSEKTAIYGEATPQEVQALKEEGVDLQAIPWVPLSDA